MDMIVEQQFGGNMVQLCGVLLVEGYGVVGNGFMQEGYWVDGFGDNLSVGYYIECVLILCSISFVFYIIFLGYFGVLLLVVFLIQFLLWICIG